MKKGVDISMNSLHPKALAGKEFTLYVYTPFLKSGKLGFEDEEYMKRFGINLVYLNNYSDLEKSLS